MQDWIISFMNQFGYLGIALLIAIENIFPPIPSELILTFGGFMTTYTNMNIWIVILFATIGSVTGAIVLYGVGRLLPTEKMERLIGRWGHVLGLKKEDVKRTEGWFIRRGIYSHCPKPHLHSRRNGAYAQRYIPSIHNFWNRHLECCPGLPRRRCRSRMGKHRPIYGYLFIYSTRCIGNNHNRACDLV